MDASTATAAVNRCCQAYFKHLEKLRSNLDHGLDDDEMKELSGMAYRYAMPVLALFLSLQRFLVEGLTKGSVKG